LGARWHENSARTEILRGFELLHIRNHWLGRTIDDVGELKPVAVLPDAPRENDRAE
jgi:hypothetical protein